MTASGPNFPTRASLMLKHHLRTSLRRLRRQKGYAAINVLGLAIGLSVCGVMLLFVRHETSYESFHERADRIHLLLHEQMESGRSETTRRIPFEVAETVREIVPGVEHVVRVMGAGELRLVRNGEVTYMTGLYHADPEVFDVFSFPLVAGNPATALLDPYHIVIDETFAQTLFGRESPDQIIGRTITNRVEWEGEAWDFDYTITGVMRDVPATTQWQPRGLVSMSTARGHLEDYSPEMYVLFREDADIRALGGADLADLPALRRRGLSGGSFLTLPIRDIHLQSGPGPAEAVSPIVHVRIFGAVALLILLLAGVNYVSMATALGLGRTRATGVQKTMGAGRWQIGSEILVESVVLSLAAAIVAMLFIWILLPEVSNATQTNLAVGLPEVPILAAALVAVASIVGLAAGAYPAVVHSRAQPAEAFRGSAPAGVAGVYVRRGLVVFQIGAFVVLFVGARVMSGQLAFIQDYDLGIEPEQVLVIDARHAQDRTAVLREFLEQHPAVLSTATGSVPGQSATRTSFPRPGAEDDEAEIIAVNYFVSPYFLRTIGAQLLAGDLEDENDPRETSVRIHLNESALAALGWTPDEAVARELHGRPVQSVFRDFHHESLHAPVEPMMVNVGPDWPHNQVLVRFLGNETRAVLAAAEVSWGEVTSGDPLKAYFLDDHFAKLYESERRIADVMHLAGLLTVLIAGMGLFALAAFTAERRRSEVAIRKVLGASVASVMSLLSRDFLKLLVAGFVIAAPAGYWLMSRWLDGFAYRIDLGPSVFVLTLGAAIVVVMAAVGYHALRAATADPVKAIRAE